MTTLTKAAQDAAKEIEANELVCSLYEEAYCQIIVKHLAPVQAELDELEKIRGILKDPAAVWVNMLRGTIARPQALDHYEDCKMRVETLEAELDRLKRENQKAREFVQRYQLCGTSSQGLALADAWLERNPHGS